MATHELEITSTIAKRLNLAGKSKEEQEKILIEAIEASVSPAPASKATAPAAADNTATILAAMAQQQEAADRRAEAAQQRFDAAMAAMAGGRVQPARPGMIATVGNFGRDVVLEASRENWRGTSYNVPVGEWARPVAVHAVASGAQIALATAVAVGTVVAVNAVTKAYTGKGILAHMVGDAHDGAHVMIDATAE